MTTNDQIPTAAQYLQRLGFTEYEALAYMTLVEHGELSGYELAKRSRIPRANIYAVADRLRQRGAVLQADGHKGQRYAAVAPDALLRSIRNEHQRVLAEADKVLGDLRRAARPASIFNVRGEELLNRARQVIEAATQHLAIALQPPEAAALAGVLEKTRARGVEILTLCMEACDPPCGGCRGDIHPHAMAPEDGSRWLLVVADGGEALVGQLTRHVREGLVTTQPMVVELALAYIRQSLMLAALGIQPTRPSGDVRAWLAAAARADTRSRPATEQPGD